ncbi:hypothetical protein IE53DRAFT_379760 [Violaceomyces palustris]|uniref:Uncharacterized protein n=1 Tax=Violaceomyces palustris TaxID=1673888 RepID=A0ACD0NXF1_9BASI|nr:hypothetical protein IE53DRAFT_379760 [Violaceomyces palustris]
MVVATQASSSFSSSTPTIATYSQIDQLISSLSRLPSEKIAVIVTQQRASLSKLISSTLQSIASQRLSQPLLLQTEEIQTTRVTVNSIFKILLNIIQRGDPSLARNLIPDSSSLIDLAIVSADSSKSLTTHVFQSFVDSHTSEQLLESLLQNLRSINLQLVQLGKGRNVSSTQVTDVCQKLGRVARIVGCLMSSLPSSSIKRISETSLKSLVSSLVEAYDSLLPSLVPSDSKGLHGTGLKLPRAEISKEDWRFHWLHAKVEILEATWAILERLQAPAVSPSRAPTGSGDSGFPILLCLEPSEGQTGEAHVHSEEDDSLLSVPLLVDLSRAYPFADEFSQSLQGDPSGKRILSLLDKEKAYSDRREDHAKAGRFKGPAWSALGSVLISNAKSSGDAVITTGDQAHYEPDPSIISVVDSILPHIGISKLKRILSKPSFRGQEVEQVVQRLLEGDQGEESDGSQGRVSTTAMTDEEAMVNTGQVSWKEENYQPPAPTAVPQTKNVAKRANIFDSQPLDLSKAMWGKNKADSGSDVALRGSQVVGGLDSDLKAAIIARAEAESEGEEEWNPFSEVRAKDVGFEEELEDGESYDGAQARHTEPDGLHRRQGLAALGGPRANASEFIRLRDSEESSEDDEVEPEGRHRNAESGGSVGGMGQKEAGGAEAEREAERTLIRFYSRNGPAAFEKDPSSRKSALRKELKAELIKVGGRGWDDGLIESWGTMFERNPRKEKLLASANDLLSGNPNRPRHHTKAAVVVHEDDESDQGSSGRFGPDKGRGGRILRGGGRGGGNPGRGGRGGGGGGVGGGSGGGSGSGNGRGGGHSGNDRSLKQKEKRGNQARQRGFDRKAARGGAGAVI